MMEKNSARLLKRKLIIEFIIIHILIISGGVILHNFFRYSVYMDTVFALYICISGIFGWRIGTLYCKLYEAIRRKDMDS